jgi:hypothetical protein
MATVTYVPVQALREALLIEDLLESKWAKVATLMKPYYSGIEILRSHRQAICKVISTIIPLAHREALDQIIPRSGPHEYREAKERRLKAKRYISNVWNKVVESCFPQEYKNVLDPEHAAVSFQRLKCPLV